MHSGGNLPPQSTQGPFFFSFSHKLYVMISLRSSLLSLQPLDSPDPLVISVHLSDDPRACPFPSASLRRQPLLAPSFVRLESLCLSLGEKSLQPLPSSATLTSSFLVPLLPLSVVLA